MEMNLRKSNVEALIQSGIITFQEKTEDTEAGYYFKPEYMGDSSPVELPALLDLCEMMAAQKNVVFRFWYNPQEEEWPWRGGIHAWRKAIEPPSSYAPQEEIDAFNARNIPAERIMGPWLSDNPDMAVFDRDLPNLFCQLLTAFVEMFEDDGYFDAEELGLADAD